MGRRRSFLALALAVALSAVAGVACVFTATGGVFPGGSSPGDEDADVIVVGPLPGEIFAEASPPVEASFVEDVSIIFPPSMVNTCMAPADCIFGQSCCLDSLGRVCSAGLCAPGAFTVCTTDADCPNGGVCMPNPMRDANICQAPIDGGVDEAGETEAGQVTELSDAGEAGDAGKGQSGDASHDVDAHSTDVSDGALEASSSG